MIILIAGNNNFSYIEDYLVYEAKRGNRSVIFYPETAYWVRYRGGTSLCSFIAWFRLRYYFVQVNVDVDVPLFLPIYAQRRQHDLRRLAVREVMILSCLLTLCVMVLESKYLI